MDREALAIVFALKKFNYYLYGQSFTLYTDNQALKDILKPKRELPAVASSRLQRWIIFISSYQCNIVHRPASRMRHADALSRLPLDCPTNVESIQINYYQMSNDTLTNIDSIKEKTKSDKILSEVLNYVKFGFPKTISDSIKPYYAKRNSLSIESDCIYYGSRIIVPEISRKGVLSALHENHTGIVRMKMLARSYVWWPSLDKNIQDFVSSCLQCQQTLKVPKEKISHPWPSVSYPFERIHIDFFYFEGKHFLLIVDTFSKFVEIKLMKTTNIFNVITKLQEFFAVFGLPTVMVSDNGPPFNSYKYKSFFLKILV